MHLIDANYASINFKMRRIRPVFVAKYASNKNWRYKTFLNKLSEVRNLQG